MQRQALRQGTVANPWRTSLIQLPEFLLAEEYENRLKLKKRLDSAIEALRQPRRRVKFDFSRTRKCYPGGTLVLLAYLELLNESYPRRVKAACQPKSLVAQLLCHFGIGGALGIPIGRSRPEHESVVNWRYLTGTSADGTKIHELIESYRQSISAEIPEGLYDVLTEALTNVRHHAYPEDLQIPDSMKRWWLFSRYNEPTGTSPGNLYIAVYDLGVGIQTSLRKKLRLSEKFAEIKDELFGAIGMDEHAQSADRLLLKHAVDHNRTSTGLAFRGKGLPEMKDFVLSTASGKLHIISGEAQYVCMAENKSADAFGCKDTFMGTLILWSIPLQLKEPQ